MYNFHTHSLLSDGVLLPSEAAARFAAAGYKAIAITDHVDYSNIDMVIKGLSNFLRHWPKNSQIEILSGVELTHIPIQQIKPLVRYARKKGVAIIIGHGETTVEPVAEGTNRAFIESGVDILAHPGLIGDEDTELAKKKKVLLEVTAREGHNRTNQYVVSQALKFGAELILNLDSHVPLDIITPAELRGVGIGAGLNEEQLSQVMINTENLLKKARHR